MTGPILLYATMNWPSAARYAGGFVAAGREVHVACPKGALATLSRYVSKTYSYRPLAAIASLRRAIATAKPELIIACDDRAIAHLLRLYDIEKGRGRGAQALATLIRASLGVPENYAGVISRAGSLNALAALDVRVPGTLAVACEADIDVALARIGLPAVFKADGSWGGEGVAIARTRDEAVAAFRKLSRAPSRLRSLARAVRRRDAHFLLGAIAPETSTVCVQKFIVGKPAASAFAAKDGKVLAHFHYDVLVTDGEIGPPDVVRRVDDAAMDRAVEAVAARFGLSGLHGLDFIRDEAGTVHLIEINPRATQGGTLPFGAGRDLPAALAQSLSESPVGCRPAIDNDIVVFFPREMRRNPSSPWLASGHHDMPSDDPAVLAAMGGGARPVAATERAAAPQTSYGAVPGHA